MVHPAIQSVSVLAGQSVTLAVEYCANPPARRIMWVTQRLLLLPGASDLERGHQFHNTTVSTLRDSLRVSYDMLKDWGQVGLKNHKKKRNTQIGG